LQPFLGSPKYFITSFYLRFIEVCYRFENILKRVAIKEWPLTPNSQDLHVTRANFSRRVTFVWKMAFGECRQVWHVRTTRLGECRRVWRVRATRLGECRRVWQVTTSTRVLPTFAKFALAKFVYKLPLLSRDTKKFEKPWHKRLVKTWIRLEKPKTRFCESGFIATLFLPAGILR
jgi:hypothetical protein